MKWAAKAQTVGIEGGIGTGLKRMGSSIRLGRLFGIPIEVNVSWVFAFLLFTFLISEQFDNNRLHWPDAQRWLVAAFTVILFFLSVLIHELSHSVMALGRGIPVSGITLFIFGGVSRLGREPQGPWTEFAVAIVGPLSNVVIAAICGGAWFLLGRGSSMPEVVLFWLAWANVGLGAFNLVPGFPLDGGRLLRAAVWGLTGSYRRGTQVAARAGQLVGVLMLAGGVVMAIFVDGVNMFDGIWIAFIGGFILTIASSNYPR